MHAQPSLAGQAAPAQQRPPPTLAVEHDDAVSPHPLERLHTQTVAESPPQ